MSVPLRPQGEPIPGYQLVELIGKGGCGEVWKCIAPGGLNKAIKIVHGDLNNVDSEHLAIEAEYRSIERIKSVRHPFLLSIDRVEFIDGRLLIVTELAERSLLQLLAVYRRAGRAGIPRKEVLGFLREAAEVLDVLNFEHGLQHLDVKPHNLFIVHNHVKVADFGLVKSLATNEGEHQTNVQLGAITPLYAAPEMFHGKISAHCDQYSLAITWQELLTGTLPFQGTSSRELLLQHTTEEPNLEPLPHPDQPIIAQALAKDPEDRFTACTDLINELAYEAEEFIQAPALRRNLPAQAWQNIADTKTNPNRSSNSDTDTEFQAKLGNAAAVSAPQYIGPYRLLHLAKTSPLLDEWHALSPDGLRRRLQHLFGFNLAGAELEAALVRFGSLQHPILRQVEVVDKSAGTIALAGELVQQTLRDQWRAYRQSQLRGIPRLELLELLHPIAEGLDYLYRQHSVQHLNLSPQVLVVEDGRLLVDEFGLYQLFWSVSRSAQTMHMPHYSAPELQSGQMSPRCDQYCLALIYIEMLSGELPKHTAESVAELGMLPVADRAPVAQALQFDPANRWPSCRDFLNALEGCESHKSQFEVFAEREFKSIIKTHEPHGHGLNATEREVADTALKQLLDQLKRDVEGGEAHMETPLTEDGQLFRSRFHSGLPLGDARIRLDEARARLFGHKVEEDNDKLVFHLDLPGNLWQQWTGKKPGLRIAVALQRQHPLSPTPIAIDVHISPYQCSANRAGGLLRKWGSVLVKQLRAALTADADKRINQRLLWPFPFDIWPIADDGARGDRIACRGKDLSLSGAGFYLPNRIESSEVILSLPATSKTEPITIPATLVRAEPCGDGWFDVGALFHREAIANPE